MMVNIDKKVREKEYVQSATFRRVSENPRENLAAGGKSKESSVVRCRRSGVGYWHHSINSDISASTYSKYGI